ncbi:hypothetical protein PCASD_09565 [Puccinia coronata f. sp. avenae]|uniref:Tet-like 2OG-Fe(II) oxygenase domain-containing protein n=1 Tax=Puccinia coronata f. sp. avenae TaxID=200324 RepID=A0A2N5V2E5_9BASI|nr:hypothetical protein PCASD_09565 [Puccinia coronata f. sp. avenae]
MLALARSHLPGSHSLAGWRARALVRSHACTLVHLHARSHACSLAHLLSCLHLLARTLALARLQPCPSSLRQLDPLAQRLAPPCTNACQALETWAYAMITIVMNPWAYAMNMIAILAQKVGRAEDQYAIDSNMEEWRQHIQDSERAGKIIWDLFYPIGNVALETNQQFMIEHNLPAFCDGHIPNTDSDNPRAKNFFSSNLTFTSEGFFNHPHKDSRDND